MLPTAILRRPVGWQLTEWGIAVIFLAHCNGKTVFIYIPLSSWPVALLSQDLEGTEIDVATAESDCSLVFAIPFANQRASTRGSVFSCFVKGLHDEGVEVLGTLPLIPSSKDDQALDSDHPLFEVAEGFERLLSLEAKEWESDDE